MKKWITTAMAAMLTFACVGCGKKEQVDEKDMSRWIVEFSSKCPNDMGKTEFTIKELKERNSAGNNFTVKFQYYAEYVEIGEINHMFNLVPDVEFYYVNDAGEKIKEGRLKDREMKDRELKDWELKDGELIDEFYSIRDFKSYDKYNEEDDEFKGTSRIIMPGEYQVKYSFMVTSIWECEQEPRPVTTSLLLTDFSVNIVVGDIYSH